MVHLTVSIHLKKNLGAVVLPTPTSLVGGTIRGRWQLAAVEMCVPVVPVKARWRVRHWSAPDRMLSSLPQDLLDDDQHAEPLEDLTAISGVVDQPSNVEELSVFSSNMEDPATTETPSPLTKLTDCCGGDSLPSVQELFFHSIWDDFPQMVKSNVKGVEKIKDENMNDRSLMTAFTDEKLEGLNTNTDTCEDPLILIQQHEGKSLHATSKARRRHVSCPSLLLDQKVAPEKDEICPAAVSQPSLPAPSLLLMLLLQRRQYLKRASLCSNTARRNLSTARSRPSQSIATMRSRRYQRESQKLNP